jgi:hypothetical protein
MDRTPIGRKFIHELIKVNDQLCYSALLHHEFEVLASHHAKSSPNDFTVSIFPTNPFSKRINRRANDLPTFGSQSRITGFRMAVIVGYELVLAYLEEIQEFRARSKPTPEDSIQEDAPEDQVFNKLAKWLPQSPNKGYFSTLGYFRHMRNSFAHGHEGPSKAFAAFAARYSHLLNRFWSNGITELNGLDFKSAISKELSAETAFAIMNLFRVLLREVDAMFASTLSLEDVLGSTVAEVVTRKPELKRNPSKAVSKVRAIIKFDYGGLPPVPKTPS